MTTAPSIPTFTAGQVLTAAQLTQLATALNFALYTRPLCKLHATIPQAIGTGVLSVLSIDATDVDTDGGRSGPGSALDRYVCRTQGWYSVSATVSYAGNGTGSRFAVFHVNGQPQNGFSSNFNALADNSGVTLSGLVHLNVGDYLQVAGFQDSGATINTAVSPAYQATALSITFELAG
jgi:hypothetical protein